MSDGFELIVSVSAGLVVLGFAFVLVDFFLVRLFQRMFPQGLTHFDGMADSSVTLNDERRLRRGAARYKAVASHKLRSLGLMVVGFGLTILASSFIWQIISLRF